jgi:hypothetical protein
MRRGCAPKPRTYKGTPEPQRDYDLRSRIGSSPRFQRHNLSKMPEAEVAGVIESWQARSQLEPSAALTMNRQRL